jgi:signal transduction histidine kinase/ActR/RegA family two-component response regulator
VTQIEKEREDGSALLAMREAAVFVCDGSGAIRGWTDAAERLLGYSAAEALGQRVAQFLDAEPAPIPDTSTVHAWTARTRAGAPSMLWRMVTSLQNGSGEALSLYLVGPRGAGTPAVAKGPESPKDLVGTLAARIAHDFSALLAPVIGNLMLLEEEISGQETLYRRVIASRQATEDARSFAQRLGALDSRRKLLLHAADLAQTVRDLLPEVRAALPPNIALVAEIETCPDVVYLERKQIGQALLHLVHNARDAMPAGGSLTVSVAAFEGTAGEAALPPGRWLRLLVRDSGRGIDPALRKHVFEPFVSTKMPSCGVGLGLPTVATIVRQHEGLLDLHSRPGQGTTVCIFLQSRGSLGDQPEQPSAQVKAAAVPPMAKASILLVEDNAMVRRSIDATLRGLGYRVLAVASGDECIALLERAPEPFDLLITDVVMPQMSGKELIDRVHGILPTVPVLFMSGYDRSTLASRKQSVASEHFLQKPFDGEDLAAAVVSAMAGDKPQAT